MNKQPATSSSISRLSTVPPGQERQADQGGILDIDVTPTPKGTEETLISVKGRYLKSGKYLPFAGEPVSDAGLLNVVLTSTVNPRATASIQISFR